MIVWSPIESSLALVRITTDFLKFTTRTNISWTSINLGEIMQGNKVKYYSASLILLQN